MNGDVQVNEEKQVPIAFSMGEKEAYFEDKVGFPNNMPILDCDESTAAG